MRFFVYCVPLASALAELSWASSAVYSFFSLHLRHIIPVLFGELNRNIMNKIKIKTNIYFENSFRLKTERVCLMLANSKLSSQQRRATTSPLFRFYASFMLAARTCRAFRRTQSRLWLMRKFGLFLGMSGQFIPFQQVSSRNKNFLRRI